MQLIDDVNFKRVNYRMNIQQATDVCLQLSTLTIVSHQLYQVDQFYSNDINKQYARTGLN